MESVKLVPSGGVAFAIEKKAVARINPKNCVNCGTCRESCPVGAIQEEQRAICRLCPECTERPALTVSEMYSLATETACTTACPLGISPQGYINLTKAGKPEEAYDLIWQKNPLPAVCSRICHHPCEQSCKRGILVDEPIAIRSIKRYLCEAVAHKVKKYPQVFEEMVAIIGAGPAGLTAAHYLAHTGYTVTVFEGDAEAGGMLVRGIPAFRLSRDIVRKEIADLEEAGIEIRVGQRINKSDFEKLKKEYDAIIVATGASNSKELNIAGGNMEGVMTSLGFMERVNNGENLRRHPGQLFKEHGEVVVIGGGSVAIDAARTALRLGASKVTAVCLESGNDIPCHPWELEEASEEGVELLEGWAPQKFVGLDPVLEGLEVAKVTAFNKDSSGKISFKIDKENKQIIKADWAIYAVGQAPDGIWAELKGDGIYLAGDVNGSGACSVVDAMASGKKTAAEVDAALRGRELKDPLDLRVLHDAPKTEKVYPATRRKTVRPERPMLYPKYRSKCFDEVEGRFDAAQAHDEVMRCLSCGFQTVDPDKCIGCGICQKLCPMGDAIVMEAPQKGGDQ